MDSGTYKVKFCFEGTEKDTNALRRYLAQCVADEIELCRVFGVEVSLDNDDVVA